MVPELAYHVLLLCAKQLYMPKQYVKRAYLHIYRHHTWLLRVLQGYTGLGQGENSFQSGKQSDCTNESKKFSKDTSDIEHRNNCAIQYR